MNRDSLIRELESDETYSELVVSNDLRSFIRRAVSLPISHKLARHIGEDRENLEKVTEYAAKLLRDSQSRTTRHHNDIALAICLLVLSKTAHPPVQALLKSASLNRGPHMAWVSEVATHYLAKGTLSTLARIALSNSQVWGGVRYSEKPYYHKETTNSWESVSIGA